MRWHEAVVRKHSDGWGMWQQQAGAAIDNPMMDLAGADLDGLIGSIEAWNDDVIWIVPVCVLAMTWPDVDIRGNIIGEQGTVCAVTHADGTVTFSSFWKE